MHQSLRVIFDNPKNVSGFMAMENHNPYFKGRRPLDIIARGDFASLYEVYKRVDALRGSGF
ncbi:antitoxin Xre/MbcA/ParS toxin-binding domain-containing protein [Exilibacterium tricleocarpae]